MNQTNITRVAQVLAGAPIGGAENFYTRLVAALAESPELEQRAYTRENPAREERLTKAGVAISTHRLAPKWQYLHNLNFRKALREWQPDIVVTYMNRASSITPPGNYQLVARLGHYYNLKNYRHCDYWVGITKGICDHLIKGGMPSERVIHIPNFVEEYSVKPLAPENVHKPQEAPILFALGRLHENKGFDILLKALPSIPNAELWLAGEGPEESALKQLASHLGVEKRVHFLGWRTDVNELMRAADVFICPSRHEGLGSIVLEAWYNECPMVVTASQGPAELVTSGVNGLVSPIDDVEALAGSINDMLSNPAAAQSLAQMGIKEYQEKYSKDIIRQQYVDFFNSLKQTHQQ